MISVAKIFNLMFIYISGILQFGYFCIHLFIGIENSNLAPFV